MKMKNRYIILLWIALLLTSCEDYLNTSSSSKLSSENVFTSLYFSEASVLGLYDLVCDAQAYGQRISTLWCTNSDIEHVGADENTYNANSYRGLSNYYATPDNLTLLWTNVYSLAERANLVVEGVRKSELYLNGSAVEQATMKALLGEALTLRALAYFELARLWGDIPFKLEPTNQSLDNVFIPKADRDSIYDCLIKDLEESADDLLPWIGESRGNISYTNSERVTKGFAKGLLARICLTRAGYSLRDKPGFPTEQGSNPEYYYELARKHLKDVIDSHKYKLKPYQQIWKDICAINKQDGVGGENLYEVAFGLGKSGEIGYSIGVRFYQNSKYGMGNNSNVVNTSAYYYYSFDQEDVRRDATVSMINYSNKVGDLKEFFQGNTLAFTFAKWDQRWMAENSTWLATNLSANGKWSYGVNWVVMRYADILLMYAEVENELHDGPTKEAKDALLEVRGRAFTGASKYDEKVVAYIDKLTGYDEFFNAIVNERAWEFGGEGVRKFDLIRWNLLCKKIKKEKAAYIDMVKGNYPVTIFDKEYTSLPKTIYYKYKIDNENVDLASINFYKELDEVTAKKYLSEGWTSVKWLNGMKEADIELNERRMTLFSSGLFKEYNGVCDNRYIFPIQAEVLNEYQGVVTNSYGY